MLIVDGLGDSIMHNIRFAVRCQQLVGSYKPAAIYFFLLKTESLLSVRMNDY